MPSMAMRLQPPHSGSPDASSHSPSLMRKFRGPSDTSRPSVLRAQTTSASLEGRGCLAAAVRLLRIISGGIHASQTLHGIAINLKNEPELTP